jgi:hypothetical protein
MRVFVDGIGLIGPGLDGWESGRRVLEGEAAYEDAPVRPKPVTLLPAAERRRAGAAIRLAIATGIEALEQAGKDPVDMPMVFAASGGDGETIHEILAVLATDQREVSPTRFHNSVHNAPSGYWSVATGSRAASVSLSSFDDSFAAGLLEAAVQATVRGGPVTLIAYDVPYPEPLHAARPIGSMFSVALVLTTVRSERSMAELTVETAPKDRGVTGMKCAALENVRAGNPAARSLPLLEAIAKRRAVTIHLHGLDVAMQPV